MSKWKITLDFPEWEDWNKFLESQKQRAAKKLNLSGALGFTFATYEQTGFSNLSELVLTPKVSGEYRLTPLWDVTADTFFTVLPLFTNPSNSGMQYFGASLKAGYRIPSLLKNPWSLKVSTGYYYSTTLSAQSGYGFQNLNGLEFLISVKRDFLKGQAAMAYLKLTPFFFPLSTFGTANSEFALGGAYFLKPFKNGSVLGISLDGSLLNVSANQSQAQLRSLTLGINYAL